MAGIWTRNYYNALTALALCDTPTTSTATPTDYTPPIRLRNPSGSYVTPKNEGFITSYNGTDYIYNYIAFGQPLFVGKLTTAYGISITGNGALIGVSFGTGITPATYEDYKLENEITSGLTLVSGSGVLTQATTLDGTHLKSTRSFTVTNSSASDITLSEFGISIAFGIYNAFLVYREVFDTPITLHPSESIVIDFNRDAEPFNYTPY